MQDNHPLVVADERCGYRWESGVIRGPLRPRTRWQVLTNGGSTDPGSQRASQVVRTVDVGEDARVAGFYRHRVSLLQQYVPSPHVSLDVE